MTTIKSNQKDSSAKGTISNPYTEEEYQQLLAEGKDIACYVEGRGFCAPAAMAPPPNPGSPSDPSDPSDPEPEPSSEPSEPSVCFATRHICSGTERFSCPDLPSAAQIELSWEAGLFEGIQCPALSVQYIVNGDMTTSDVDEDSGNIDANPEYMINVLKSTITARWLNDYKVFIEGKLIQTYIGDPIPGLTIHFLPTIIEFSTSYFVPSHYFDD